MIKVLFCLKYRENSWGDYNDQDYSSTNGYSGQPLPSGLFNSARYVVDMLNKNDIYVKLVHCTDNNAIHKFAVDYQATHLILEALWVTPEKIAELKSVLPDIKIIIRNHSEIPFLSNEGIAMDWILRYLEFDNVTVASNAVRAAEQFKMLSDTKFGYPRNVTYLPNFYPIEKVKMRKNLFSGDVINIGCMGAIRILKNQLMQAICAIEFAKWVDKPMNFHINATRIEGGASPVLKNIRELFENYTDYNLVEHRWNSNYGEEIISKMDIGMQVSYSETFNIVTADFLSRGIPSVTSKEIFWNEPLLQANPSNPYDILCKMKRAFYMSKYAPQSNRSFKNLEKYNKESEKLWVNYFKESS
jgi:hypothetical protein